jgi:DNA-binding transcriptional MerR regulator
MITPKQVSESLNVPSSTIRRWAVRFEDVLSKQESKKRMYTMEDLDTFRKIRDYSKQGKSLDNIADKLKIVASKVDQEQKPETGLILHPELVSFMQNIAEQNVALQLQLDKMKAQQDKQNELIAWLMLPWRKRLFKQMPGVEKQENR